MITLSDFCRDLFLLAYVGIASSGPIRGCHWEQRVAGYLAKQEAPVCVSSTLLSATGRSKSKEGRLPAPELNH